MTRQIYRYPLVLSASQQISVPKDAVPLNLAKQYDVPILWVEFEPHSPQLYETWQIEIIGTGHTFDDDELVPLGSVIMAEGAFVWHIYYKVLFNA